MRHLLGGVALAALLAAGLPAAAQTSSTPQPQTPPAASNQNTPVTPNNEGMNASPSDTRSTTKPGTSGQSGMSSHHGQSGTSQPAASNEPGSKMKGKHAGKSHTMARRHGGTAPEDNMAEELNRQELAKVQQNAAPTPGSGTSGMPSQPAPGSDMPSPSGTGGTMQKQ